jgi:magnesium and cobalt exporter, CNNM family
LDDSSSALSLISILLLVEILLTLAFTALQNSRQSELQEQADIGKSYAKSALKLLNSKSQLHLTYNVSMALLTTGITLISTIWLLLPAFNDQGQFGIPLAIFLVFLISLLSLILGNMVSEAIGSGYAMFLTSLLVLPLRIVILLLSPLTIILLTISTLLAKFFGSDKLVNKVTEEEIMSLVNEGHSGGTIEDEEKEMIYSILQLDETFAREIMVPRIDIISAEVKTNLKDAMNVFIESGFSRIPVYEENIDNIVGLLYAKDLLGLLNNGGLSGHSVRELLRSAYFVPETRAADDLLRDLQARNVHMAIVVDEYGGTSGLVTIENIMEEIVGDIRDEYDLNEETEYIQHTDDEYIIDAGMDIDDLNELLGTDISSDETDTLGGYIFFTIGRIPIVGETIDTDELHMTVRSIEGRRIRKVVIKVKQQQADNSPENVADDETELAPHD